MKKQILLNTLRSLKKDARALYNSELHGIFGSYAREDQSDESDVDILVKFLPGATLLDLTGLGNFLEQKLNIKVDVISDRAIRDEIKPYINKDLIVI